MNKSSSNKNKKNHHNGQKLFKLLKKIFISNNTTKRDMKIIEDFDKIIY